MTTDRKQCLIHSLWRVLTYSTELGVAFLFMVSGWLPVYGVIALTCFLFVITHERLSARRRQKC